MVHALRYLLKYLMICDMQKTCVRGPRLGECHSHTNAHCHAVAKAYESKTSAATRRYGSDVPRHLFPTAQLQMKFSNGTSHWEHLDTSCCLSLRPNVIH